MAPVIGLWGKRTSTLDWCEENYEVTYYISEFWNTISNVIFFYLCIMGIWHSKKTNLERRYYLCYLLLGVVGLGSFLFHMTLLYPLQLCDELPMIFGAVTILYTALEVNSKKGKTNHLLIWKLIAVATIICVVYVIVKYPLVHQGSYAIIAVITVVLNLRVKGGPMEVFMAGAVIYSFGFILWNIDNIYCYKLNNLRAAVPGYLRPVTQLHAWWHIFTGYGSYLSIIFSSCARMTFLKRQWSIKLGWAGLYMDCPIEQKTP